VIVVLGRPGLDADDGLDRTAGRIAVAAAEAGGRVELVGSVGDDADGDTVITELGRAGIGHAAVLRDPGGVTPRSGEETEADEASDPERDRLLPRLDAADIDLGLHYLSECHVLVVAELLSMDALRVATDAASYHGAALVVLTAGGEVPATDLPEDATVLEEPAGESAAFAELVGRYAALLDAGTAPADAWRDAVDELGWEQATE
jgi:sugar/nucleoside kinase (ribokinase family)